MTGSPEIYEMTSALSTMLDSGLQNTLEQSGYTTLEQELEYIGCYLKIQSFRFPDKFTYHVECCDPSLLKLYIPRLSVEPFVENSFIHGIEELDNLGLIQLNIQKEKEFLLVQVIDNGCGFDPASVTANFMPKDIRSSERHHIGISNTDKRIKLLFGSQYGVSFTSEPFKQTIAYIRLPILTSIPKNILHDSLYID